MQFTLTIELTEAGIEKAIKFLNDVKLIVAPAQKEEEVVAPVKEVTITETKKVDFENTNPYAKYHSKDNYVTTETLPNGAVVKSFPDKTPKKSGKLLKVEDNIAYEFDLPADKVMRCVHIGTDKLYRAIGLNKAFFDVFDDNDMMIVNIRDGKEKEVYAITKTNAKLMGQTKQFTNKTTGKPLDTQLFVELKHWEKIS